MKLLDVIERNGRLSHTKTSYIIGVLVSTWIVIHAELNHTLTPDMFLYYSGILMLGTIGSKGVDAYKSNNKTTLWDTTDTSPKKDIL